MLLDQFHLLRKTEPSHPLAPADLFSAVEHLVKASQLLEECRETMEEGSVDASMLQKLEESWNEVNLCRVHTEDILFIEELLIPTLGEINDARSMLESLIAWKLGMTRQAYYSITGCLTNALGGIRPCIEELSSWEGKGAADGNESAGVGGW
ncbi:MAG: hypothetical protein MUF52_08465 [Syntrophobacteraceae bacterium]|jgi:hypothetical protein|nr:hypothetical protein [Syntrophobacteraceae bacterium]